MSTTPAFSFKHGDAQWEALRKRSLEDLFFFNSVVLGYANRFPLLEDTHLLLHRFAERRTGVPDLDTAPMQLILTPREVGKSTCFSRGHPIQLICANPNTAILLANEKAETAQAFLSEIQDHFEHNELLRALFPEVIPEDFRQTTWSTSELCVRRTVNRPESTVETIGAGGTKVGMHPDIIICDDLISNEAMENARAGSWLVMDRVNRWTTRLRALLSSSAKPFPWVRFIGTHWWNGDTYDFIERTFGHGEEPRRYLLKVKLSDGSTAVRAAYRAGDLAVIKMAAIEGGVAVFPKIHSMEKLQKLRQENPEEFACQYQNDPTDAIVRTFQDSWLRYWQHLDAHTAYFKDDAGQAKYALLSELHKVMIVDPAFTSSGEGARSAAVIVGTDFVTGKRLLLDVWAGRLEPRDLVTEVLNRAQRWGLSRLFVEAVAQQKGFIQFVQSEAAKRGMALAVDEVRPGGRNKDVRIEGLSVYFKAGQLLVHASQLDFLEEYRKYRPGARLRDVLDALAYAPEVWPALSGRVGQSAQTRSTSQLASFRARRNARYLEKV